MNPFEILGIPLSFRLDLSSVEKQYRALSRVVHPDKFVSTGAAERKQALTKAVSVNEAWRIVRDPILRAEALLRLHETPMGTTQEPIASAEFLMEIMELREQLGEARSEGLRDNVAQLAKTMKNRESAVFAQLDEMFRALQSQEDGDARQNTREHLRRLVGELRYLRRFLEEAQSIEETLSPLMALAG